MARNEMLIKTIDRIRDRHRRRTAWHKAEKALTLQGKAVCRRIVGGDKAEGSALFDVIARYGEPMLEEIMSVGHANERISLAVPEIYPLLIARAQIMKSRDDLEREIEQLVLDLPVVEWATKIHGVGVGSIAAIIGQTGNLWNYPTVRKLWKRLGLGVGEDGRRQRNVPGTSEAERLINGYNGERRSVVWNIGTSIMFAQSARIDKATGEIKKEAGEWRKIYDNRRAYEEAKNDRGEYAAFAEMLLKTSGVGKTTESYKAYSIGRLPKAHLKNRAQRFMEKQFIKQLWLEWRKSMIDAKPSDEEIKKASTRPEPPAKKEPKRKTPTRKGGVSVQTAA